jgi:hypothetical protein
MTLFAQFPDRPVEELTKVATLFSLLWEDKVPNPRKDYNVGNFCELVEANVGVPVDRKVIMGVVATAFAAQERGEDVVSIMPHIFIED